VGTQATVVGGGGGRGKRGYSFQDMGIPAGVACGDKGNGGRGWGRHWPTAGEGNGG
jgi:hypothetical protein